MRVRSVIPILVLALVVRVYWAATKTGAIENEGAVYASLAASILAGKGYVAITGGGTFFLFPPLYPLLIGALSPFAPDLETAGRAVSILSGALMTVPVFLIAATLYTPPVACIAALLIALHPLLVGYSAAVYSEPTYLLFLMMAIYFALRAQQLRSYVPSALSGVAFALACLTRLEAFVLPFAAVPIIVLVNLRKLRQALLASGILLTTFILLLLPYIVFLSVHTGQIRVEAKSPIFFALLQRMASGMSYREAAYGIDSDLREVGVYLKPPVQIVQSTSVTRSDLLSYLAAAGPSNIAAVVRALIDRRVGSILLAFLVAFGLLRTPWDRERISRELLLLAMFVALLGALLAVQWFPTRYVLPLLSLLIVWAAKGIDELTNWVTGTSASLFVGPRALLMPVWATSRTLLVVALLGVAFTGARYESELTQGYVSERPIKDAGLWLGNAAPGPKMIMDVAAIIPFYAGGTLAVFPYCDSATTLKYIEKKKPDFIILASHTSDARPYLRAWLEMGIPDPRAIPIYRTARSDGGQIVIYQWGSGSESSEGAGAGDRLHAARLLARAAGAPSTFLSD